jgi:hypothetical protein
MRKGIHSVNIFKKHIHRKNKLPRDICVRECHSILGIAGRNKSLQHSKLGAILKNFYYLKNIFSE